MLKPIKLMSNLIDFLRKSRATLLALTAILSCVSVFSQGYWENYNTNNGLLQNQLTSILIEDESKIWLLTDFEISSFNSVTKQFGPAFNSSNSNLVGQNYRDLIQANGRVWFSHDNGITAIDSGVFINYSTTNGLISNDIRGMTVDTSGNLWVASPQGVSHFNGTNFIHDTTVAAYHIAIDDSNRVFIVDRRFNIIFNNNGPFTTHKVYDGTAWTIPTVTGLGTFPVGLLNIKFHQTSEGIYVTSKDYDAGLYKLSYPFHFDSIPLRYPLHQQNSSRPFRINNIHIDDGNRKWIISDDNLVLFSTIDSVLKPHHLNPEIEKYTNSFFGNEIVTSKGPLTIFACNTGISLGYNIKEPAIVTAQLRGNLIRTSISSLGPLFNDLDNGNSLFEYPNGSGRHGIYQAQFVHAHKQSSNNFYETNLVNIFNRTHEMGPVSSKSLIDRQWVIRMTKSEIDLHLASVNNRGYVSPPNIKNWPTSGSTSFGAAMDLAPFVDVDNDGCYNPDIGDYPYIKGDEALFWINHINQFEYHGMLYAYNDTTNANLQRTVFVDYTIINRDSTKYDSVRFGMYVDFDLGNANDDYLGADTAVNGFYVYNADNFDEGGNGYGANPPALGVRFLSDDLDGFVSYSNGNNYNGTPTNPQHMYNYLQGKWRDGVAITSSGNGRNSGGAATTTMYTGDPVTTTGWTELGPPAQLFADRRGIASIPYFGLNIGEKKTISLAISYGSSSSSSNVGSAVAPLRTTWNVVKQHWDTISNPSPSYTMQGCTVLTNIAPATLKEKERLHLFPNPNNGLVNIRFEASIHSKMLSVFGSNGQLVLQQEVSGEIVQLNLSELPEGMYFIRVGNLSEKVILLKR